MDFKTNSINLWESFLCFYHWLNEGKKTNGKPTATNMGAYFGNFS